jgi:hypothetical protein
MISIFSEKHVVELSNATLTNIKGPHAGTLS